MLTFPQFAALWAGIAAGLHLLLTASCVAGGNTSAAKMFAGCMTIDVLLLLGLLIAPHLLSN